MTIETLQQIELRSGTTRRALLSFIQWSGAMLFTLFLGLFTTLIALARAQKTAHVFATFWGKVLTIMTGASVIVENEEKICRDRPTIILSNHQSMFDIILHYSFLNKQFRWMAKSSLFRIPVLGWAMSGAGYIPVERDNRRLALQSLFRAADEIRGGKSVIIFPEGTFGHEDGSLIAFKKGAFLLAKKANVAIQPITVIGSRKIVPDVPEHIMPRIYPGTVRVHVHDVIEPETYQDMSPEQLSAHVRSIIERPLSVAS